MDAEGTDPLRLAVPPRVSDDPRVSDATQRLVDAVALEARYRPSGSRTADPGRDHAASQVTVLSTVLGVPEAFDDFAGYPPADDTTGKHAAWVYADPADPHILTIMTHGSSSCPDLPGTFSTAADGALAITIETDLSRSTPSEWGPMCTADLALTTTVIGLPADVVIPSEITFSGSTAVEGGGKKAWEASIPVRPGPPS
jgi:hypothetical protein